MFLKELGFTVVVEGIIKKCQQQVCPFIGHNMMYDILYLFDQFVMPLPDTFLDFSKEWNKRFPHTFDTKVLSLKADYFGKTALGKVYEKCMFDKRIKDILKFKYDPI
jgi:hypothetical protein